jgi:hypothetical protein
MRCAAGKLPTSGRPVRPWTTTEIALLDTLRVTEVARRTGRTLTAVYQRRHQLLGERRAADLGNLPARPVNSGGCPAEPEEAIDPRELSAKRLSETLVAVLTPCRHRASEREGDAIEEALRRLKEHERLLRHVLPELRGRLAAAGSATAQEAGQGLARKGGPAYCLDGVLPARDDSKRSR